MKKIFVTSVLLVILLSLYGCGQQKIKSVNEQVEINLWIMPNSLEPANDVTAILEEFHANNPNIKVKITSLDWGAAWVRITTAAMSGDAPDIVQLGTTWVGAISGMQAIMDMSGKVHKYSFNHILNKSEFSSNVLWQDLLVAGYIDEQGKVTDKFKSVTTSKELDLNLKYNKYITKIYDRLVIAKDIDVDQIGGADHFLPSSWRTSGIEGSAEVTAIPWFVDSRAMYYRTDVFNKLGLTKDDLATWESFKLTLKKIKDANLEIDGRKVFPLGISGKNDWNVVHNLAPWIWGAGGFFLADDFKSGRLSSKNSVDGLAYYISLVLKGYVPETCLEKNTAQIENDFNNGDFAIMFGGSNQLRGLTTPRERGGAADTYVAKRFDVAPYPAGPKGRFTFVGGSNLAIFKSSKNKQQAWAVIKYLVAKDSQVEYSKLNGFMPATIEAFDDLYFTGDSRRAVYKEAVQYGRAYPSIPSWGLIEPVLARRFGIMWDYVLKGDFNQKNLMRLLQEADSDIRSTLKRNG